MVVYGYAGRRRAVFASNWRDDMKQRYIFFEKLLKMPPILKVSSQATYETWTVSTEATDHPWLRKSKRDSQISRKSIRHGCEAATIDTPSLDSYQSYNLHCPRCTLEVLIHGEDRTRCSLLVKSRSWWDTTPLGRQRRFVDNPRNAA